MATPASEKILPISFSEKDFRYRYPPTPSSSLTQSGVIPILKREFFNLTLTMRPVDPELAEGILETTILGSGEEALQLAIARERQQEGELYSPLCALLGIQAGNDVDAKVPIAFLEQVVSHIPPPFDAMRALEELYRCEPILQIIRQVNLEFSKSPANLDAVINLILEAQHEWRNFALSPEALFGLTCLPYKVRFAVQDFILLSTDRAELKTIVSDNHHESALTTLIDRYLELSTFSNNHWDILLKQFGASESLVLRLSEIKEERTYVEAMLKHLTSGTEGHDLLCRFFGLKEYLRGKLKANAQRQYGDLAFWQETDVGHGFAFYYTGALLNMLREDNFSGVGKAKSGQCSVILEDDPRQMLRWEKLISDCSEYNLLPGQASRCICTSEVIAHLNNPNVKHFVLDIEIGEQKSAGIEVMVILLEQFFSAQKDIKHVDRDLSIVVWSSSIDRIREATEALSVLRKQPWGEFVNTNSFSCSQNRVSVNIRLKSELPF